MHTPGPWRVGKPANRDPKVLSIRSGVIWGTIYVVAQATRWDRDMPEEEWEANARLIAAAPDLLEALKGLVIWSERTWAGGSDEVPNLKEARAAIAKAEGK